MIFSIYFLFLVLPKIKKQTIHSLTPAHSITAKELIGRPKSPVRNTHRVYPDHEEV